MLRLLEHMENMRTGQVDNSLQTVNFLVGDNFRKCMLSVLEFIREGTDFIFDITLSSLLFETSTPDRTIHSLAPF
jgi:hypothetical protein